MLRCFPVLCATAWLTQPACALDPGSPRQGDLRYTMPSGAISRDPAQVYGQMPVMVGAAGGNNTLYASNWNDTPQGQAAFPTAITGHAELHSIGGQSFAAYFEAQGFVPGVVTTEIDAFNKGSADAPSTYPWSRSFGIPTPLPIAITCGAGGKTYKAGACMEIVREGMTNGQFQFGLTFQKDAVAQAGIYMDADATSGPRNNLILRNTGRDGALPILIQTTGPDNGASSIEHRTATGQTTWAIRNDGKAEFNAAVDLSHASSPDMRWSVTSAAADTRIWSAWASSDGAWHLRTANDAFTVGEDAIAVHRRGIKPTDITFGAPVKLPLTTVAALPACTLTLQGAMMAVTDAQSPTYRTSLTGGGSESVPAFCNGRSWIAY